MNRITNILVPVDFSEASKDAMQYGARLALRFQARLVAAHVVPSFAALSVAFPGDRQGFERQVLAEAERRLPAEIPESFRTRLKTVSIVRGGDVRDELLNIVDSEKIDLIVMGTHGRQGLQRFFLGSTAEHMLRNAPVPILTVSRRSEEVAQWQPEVPFQKVVYATDLSEAADEGFHYCVDVARSLGAQMTLLHVLDVKHSVSFVNDPEIRAGLQARLRQLIEREDCIGLPFRTEVGEGTPYLRILKFAEETSADLLIINQQSNDLRERALLGSTAERVIRSSRIPVLSIPSSMAVHSQRTSNVDSDTSVEASEARIA
jgi:nucleotide-binding universal stress UspA family protein